MNKKSEKIKSFRLFVLKQIESLTGEQLNIIPAGYNNNFIWNLGHLVSAMQAICYKRAGLPITIDDKYVIPYLPTTRPGHFIISEEITVIKNLMPDTIDTLQNDVELKIFGNYTKSKRIEEIYVIDVSNIDDALEFLVYYEGFQRLYSCAKTCCLKI